MKSCQSNNLPAMHLITLWFMLSACWSGWCRCVVVDTTGCPKTAISPHFHWFWNLVVFSFFRATCLREAGWSHSQVSCCWANEALRWEEMAGDAWGLGKWKHGRHALSALTRALCIFGSSGKTMPALPTADRRKEGHLPSWCATEFTGPWMTLLHFLLCEITSGCLVSVPLSRASVTHSRGSYSSRTHSLNSVSCALSLS